MGLSVQLPQPVLKGRGSFTMPPLTESDMEQIRARAEQLDDQQIKTDIFRLIAAATAAR